MTVLYSHQGCNYDHPKKFNPHDNLTMMAIKIATITGVSINNKSFIFVSLLLSRGLASGNRTFNFDCGIDLSVVMRCRL